MTMCFSYLGLLIVAMIHNMLVISAQPPCNELHILGCKNRDKPDRFFDISDYPIVSNTDSAWKAVCGIYRGPKGESVRLVIKPKDDSDFYMCLMCATTDGVVEVKIIRYFATQSVSETISLPDKPANVVCFKKSTPEFVHSVEMIFSRRNKKRIKVRDLHLAGCKKNSENQTCACPCPTSSYTSLGGFHVWDSGRTALMNDLMDQKTQNKILDNSCQLHKSCDAILKASTVPISSGIYKIQMPNGEPLDVYCDMETDGGGWLVFQRRQDGSVDFYRNWEDYKNGFGQIESEFWLGNEVLSILTSVGQYEMRVDLEDFDNDKRHAKYSPFKIAGAGYTLTLGTYSGDAGESMNRHRDQTFATFDQDTPQDCAARFMGAWWYNPTACHEANLNGLYLNGHTNQFATGVVWFTFRGYHYSLKFTEMKFRPI